MEIELDFVGQNFTVISDTFFGTTLETTELQLKFLVVNEARMEWICTDLPSKGS